MVRHYCGSSIVGIASSYNFSLSKNPASKCALFVNESTVKCEQRTEFLLTQSGSSLKCQFTEKLKLPHALLTLKAS